ncbi:hypothetical protein B296_00035147 [Ensete ventricosum]|uniref:BRISC and BRCA1-A complex member 2 n=1 Tax=Ensete ventricosum TaxID=4639 RepID=A0A427A6A5_ENSVE|nr:hypothetical protein B296_00035147 [Ensete ventricosum]
MFIFICVKTAEHRRTSTRALKPRSRGDTFRRHDGRVHGATAVAAHRCATQSPPRLLTPLRQGDVIYDALHPSVAPDVVFSSEDDDFDPLGDIASEGEARVSKSSLCDWNSKDPSRLMALVHELRFSIFFFEAINARRRVGELDDARLKFEMNTMLPREAHPSVSSWLTWVLDMAKRRRKFGQRPLCQWKPGLGSGWTISRSYSSAPAAPRVKLVSTSEVKTLFSIEDVKLPPWCMAEYLPAIEDNLKLQAHFSIPIQFPKQQPTLVMQSSQHFNSQGTPISSPPINDYPWSPRWDPPQMAERVFEFLADECLNFKKFCIDAIPQ